ncbi:MAG: hypothetical protein AAGJ53_03740, partial [Pseudomonadota bacterium]
MSICVWAAADSPRVTHARLLRRHGRHSLTALIALGILAAAGVASTAQAAPTPIRTSASNQVPACVTPARLMAFLQTRNKRPIRRFR